MNIDIINNNLFKKGLIFIYIFIFSFLIIDILEKKLPNQSINFENKKYIFNTKNIEYFENKDIKIEKKELKKIIPLKNNENNIDNFVITGQILKNDKKFVILVNKINKKSYIVKDLDTIEDTFEVLEINNKYIKILDGNKNQRIILFNSENKNNNIEDKKFENNKPNFIEVNKPIIQEQIINKEDLLKYKNNLQEIFKEISFEELKNSNQIEFKINYLKEGSLFDIIGLQKNDIIKEIDNKTIEDYSQLLFFFNNIENLDKIDLTIIRKNQLNKISYELK